MDLKTLAIVFSTVFLAELGDKTQLATLLFAADTKHSPWGVFLAASVALICAAALGVLAGSYLAEHINTRILSILAGVGFIVIGGWTLFSALRGA